MMPAIMRGGAAIFDFDGDGDLDIYLTNSGDDLAAGERAASEPNRLFRQEADGTFTDVSESSGLDDRGYGMGCAVGDVDNDGDLDVYVTNFGPDAFYRNNGDGTFSDVTLEVGLDDDAWSTSAVFLDFDRDGYLDLYVARYLDFDADRVCTDEAGRPDFCGPTEFAGVADVLYRNEGGRVFRDVSIEAGMDAVRDAGLGVVAADFNDDGWIDIYVANDADPNNLWINQRNGTFVDEAVLLGCAYNQHGLSEAGMGVTAGDPDGDGDLDLFVTHLIDESNTYYESLGAAGYEDSTARTGLGVPSLTYTGFGTVFADLDNDGDEDLIVVNGATKRRPVALAARSGWFWNDYAEPNLVLANTGRGQFVDVSSQVGTVTAELEVGRAVVAADIDADGDLDLLIVSTGAPARLYRNRLDGGGWWVEIRAIDPRLRRAALGARIVVVTASRRYTRHLIPAGGYQSSGHARIHLGLGPETRVERFEVRWPDGREEVFAGSDAGRLIELVRGSGGGS